MKIAMIYASEHGSCAEIAGFVGERLGNEGWQVEVWNARDKEDFEISDYDVVILGSPIYKGIFHGDMLRLLVRGKSLLKAKSIFVWVACVRVLEPGGLAHVEKHYISQDVHDLHPIEPIGVFAGKLDYHQLNEEDRWAFYLRYDGETLMRQFDGDFRDWDAIGAWTDGVVTHLMRMRGDVR